MLLNTLDKQYIVIENPRIISLLQKIQSPPQGGIIEIVQEWLSDSSVRLFIDEAKNKYIGDVIEMTKDAVKPMQFFPIGDVVYDLDRIESLGFGTSLDYLHEITIYLNNSCSAHCSYCSSCYKQLACCTKFNQETGVDVVCFISKLLLALNYYGLKVRINLVGTDAMNGMDRAFFSLLKDFRENCHLVIHGRNLFLLDREITLFFDNRTSVIVDVDSLDILKKGNWGSLHVLFLIRNEWEYDLVRRYIQNPEIHLHSFEIRPFYDGTNYSFFKKNIFTDETDIMEAVESLEGIYRNKHINTNYFGQLFFYPDGSAYTNLFFKSVGNIMYDSLSSICEAALDPKRSAWFLTRQKDSCAVCLYKYVCSPISNYELAIKKYALCYKVSSKINDRS